MDEVVSERNDNSESPTDLQDLQSRIKQLELKEKVMEEEFGLKRAKFMDMYLQKEEELGQRDKLLATLEEEKTVLASKVQALQQEVDDARSQVAIVECQKENEIEQEKRKCLEEIASLQHIMKESVVEAERETHNRLEKDISRLRRVNEKLEEELIEVKGQQQQTLSTSGQSVHDKEGVLAVVTKSLKQKVGNLGGPNPFSGMSTENLEESMRKAQEDAEMLRSLVLPLEEEIKALKDKLRSTDDQLRSYEAAFSALVKGLGSDALLDHMLNGKSPCEVVQHLDEKLSSLSAGLQAEKASRSDLEMYVAVLNTQKAVNQEDMEHIKKQLQEVCALLEAEKREHCALKRTWQMANDQFLEAQRLQIQDMRRIQGVLSLEQQRQIMALKKKDEVERQKTESTQHNHQEPQNKSSNSSVLPPPLKTTPGDSVSLSKSNHLYPKPLPLMLHRRLHSVESKAKLSSYEDISKSAPENISWVGSDADNSQATCPDKATTVLATSELSSSPLSHELRRTRSSSDLHDPHLNSTPLLASTHSADEVEGISKTNIGALNGEELKDPAHLLLTQDQVNSLADLTPELEARSTLLESARAEPDTISLVGKRLVSEREWKLLEEELGHAREKLGQACQMCGNYELQLQQLQSLEQDKGQQLRTVNHTLERYKEDLRREQGFRDDLELKFTQATQEYEVQVRDVFKQIEESEKLLSTLKADFSSTQQDVLEQLKQLSTEREQIRQELILLVEDNDVLLGKHLSHSHKVSSEDIDLPNSIEEMQFQYLKLRDEHIIALEKSERAQSEILILREQIQSEKQQRDAMENMLSQEMDALRDNAAISDKLRQHSHTLESRLKTSQDELQALSIQNKAASKEFQAKIEKVKAKKEQSEQDISALRAKVHSLQTDLEISECVQKDFVKLSQSLQMELEKIRQADSEVRWQHEDDVSDCGACKRNFSSRKEKHHCSHCGKIFCSDCSAKTVSSGPKQRICRVCNVCHTLLNPKTAPYFSCEPPQTPS